MQDRGVAPDVFAYNAWLDGLLRNAQIDVAISLRKKMEKKGVAPDIVIRVYNTIINGLCEAGRLVEATKVFSTLVSEGLQLDVTTYSTQIKVLCKQGLLGDATKLLKEMADNGCSPDEGTYNNIIQGFLNANDIARALDHFHNMMSHGFAAHVGTTSLAYSPLPMPVIQTKLWSKSIFLEKNGMLICGGCGGWKEEGADDSDVMYSFKRDFPLHHLKLDYCNKFGHAYGTVRFVYKGISLLGNKTPDDFQMKNGCVIDAHVDQNGGTFRTVGVEVDETCWFTLLEEAEKCVGFNRNVDALFFLNPNGGLERAMDDSHAQVICSMGVKDRVVEFYIVVGGDVPQLMKLIEYGNSQSIVKMPCKLIPRRKVEVISAHENGGPPLSPFTVETLIESHSKEEQKSSKKVTKTPKKGVLKTPQKSQQTQLLLRTSPRLRSKQISPVIPEPSTIQVNSSNLEIPGTSYDFNDVRIEDLFNSFEKNAYVAALESDISEVEEDNFDDDSVDDDELKEVRGKQKEWNAKALAVAHQLQLEAASGKLSGQRPLVTNITNDTYISDYDNSDDEVHTPGNSDEESIPGQRVTTNVPVVNQNTDFAKLKWCVGIKFPNTDTFRDCVIRYAVAQGRDLTFDISDRPRGKKLRVRCKAGCPFRLYGSWDNQSATFLTKSVDPNHTCHRTMESNRQLKSTWLAKQFLDVFKANPHWPAADIIDTVRKAYKVIIKKGFAYKVKYYAHRLFHGSMKEHYSRLGSYMAALEQGNPTSTFTLFTNPNITSNPEVFQRFFVCFDALKQGWLLGCRKLLCVDSCFLKTFLGGQLMAVIGRDANEQMFPLAWAVVEGENNETCLGEEDGSNSAIKGADDSDVMYSFKRDFPLHHLKLDYCNKLGHAYGTVRFVYKGISLLGNKTPDDFQMKNGCVINAHVDQNGG
ncbi:hypothetical protein KSS87_015101 [Heliosperma pusillum]|nr:hypothetical protein KSS87_015101 [Heliosperma pusillum]